LEQYQRALARAVCNEPLSEEESALLGDMTDHPGLALTTRIRRSWCEGRTARSALLTLSALSPNERTQHLSTWVNQGGGTHSHVHLEGEAFLTFLAARLEDPSDALSLCRLELAIIRARLCGKRDAPDQRLDARTMVRRSPAAVIVALPLSIVRLLAGPVEETWQATKCDNDAISLLVAPGLSTQVRAATPREWAFWHAAVNEIRAGSDLQTARELFALGALERT
jgi:hypothetical protein